MKFIQQVEISRFDEFVRRHPTKSHFMQSAAWGELCQKQKGFKPEYVGLEADNGELVAAALLLGRRPTGFPLYYYCPRGPVLDYSDRELLFEFLGAIRDFAKSRRAMFVKFDPDIALRYILDDGSTDPTMPENSSLIDELKAFGCIHMGFNREFEGRQPRYTFRIDLTPDDAEIDRRFTGNLLKNVKKSRRYACEVVHGTGADVKELHRLIGITSERDDFVGYGEDYYQSFFDILSSHDMATLYLGRVYPAKTVENLRAELAALLQKRTQLKKEGPLHESELSEQRLLREIETFEKYAAEFPQGATISAHLVVRYGDKAWAVHAGSDKRMSETFINNRVYYEKIHEAKANGALLLDQFGTVGDPENSHLRSLHEFKKQFGGRYIEFIGEFDLPTRPAWRWLYAHALPLYRRARISLKLALRSHGKKGGEA